MRMTNRGSTLIEVLVAMLILTSGVLGMAQLFLAAAATNAAARETTISAALAAQKMEQLLSTELPETPDGVDHVDASGLVVGDAESPPVRAIYTRRWSIEPVSEEVVMIRVRVFRRHRASRTDPASGGHQLVTFATRRRS